MSCCLSCGNTRQAREESTTEKEELQGAATCIIESEFVQNTTCHGMAFWQSSRYTVQRVFWILLVLGKTELLTCLSLRLGLCETDVVFWIALTQCTCSKCAFV